MRYKGGDSNARYLPSETYRSRARQKKKQEKLMRSFQNHTVSLLCQWGPFHYYCYSCYCPCGRYRNLPHVWKRQVVQCFMTVSRFFVFYVVNAEHESFELYLYNEVIAGDCGWTVQECKMNLKGSMTIYHFAQTRFQWCWLKSSSSCRSKIIIALHLIVVCVSTLLLDRGKCERKLSNRAYASRETTTSYSREKCFFKGF